MLDRYVALDVREHLVTVSNVDQARCGVEADALEDAKESVHERAVGSERPVHTPGYQSCVGHPATCQRLTLHHSVRDWTDSESCCPSPSGESLVPYRHDEFRITDGRCAREVDCVGPTKRMFPSEPSSSELDSFGDLDGAHGSPEGVEPCEGGLEIELGKVVVPM